MVVVVEEVTVLVADGLESVWAVDGELEAELIKAVASGTFGRPNATFHTSAAFCPFNPE